MTINREEVNLAINELKRSERYDAETDINAHY